jgi:hypothetical protein
MNKIGLILLIFASYLAWSVSPSELPSKIFELPNLDRNESSRSLE